MLLYFWRDIWRILRNWAGSLTGRVPRSDPDARMGWFIIVGSAPIVVIGFLMQDLIRDQLRSLWFVATSLIVFGVILGLADILGRNAKQLEQLTWRDGVLYGFAQALALIPGVSRSGGTITAGRLMGYTRPAAARYSFLLAVPAVFGAGLYELYSALKDDGTTSTPWGATIIATVIGFGVGLAIIHWLMKYISKGSFMPFVLYRIGLGTLILILLMFGVMDPLAGGHA